MAASGMGPKEAARFECFLAAARPLRLLEAVVRLRARAPIDAKHLPRLVGNASRGRCAPRVRGCSACSPRAQGPRNKLGHEVVLACSKQSKRVGLRQQLSARSACGHRRTDFLISEGQREAPHGRRASCKLREKARAICKRSQRQKWRPACLSTASAWRRRATAARELLGKGSAASHHPAG